MSALIVQCGTCSVFLNYNVQDTLRKLDMGWQERSCSFEGDVTLGRR